MNVEYNKLMIINSPEVLFQCYWSETVEEFHSTTYPVEFFLIHQVEIWQMETRIKFGGCEIL